MADEDEVEFITLDYEDGTSEECEVLGVFESGDGEYVALSPETHPEDVYLYVYNETDDGDFYVTEIPDTDYDQVSSDFDDLWFADADEDDDFDAEDSE